MLVPICVQHITSICSRDTSRYALQAVAIERDEVEKPHAVAIDGKRVLHISWTEDSHLEYPGADPPQPGPTKQLIDGKTICECAKLPPRQSFKRELSCNMHISERQDGKVVLSRSEGIGKSRSITDGAIDGCFPNWRDVFTSNRQEQSIEFLINPKLFAELLIAIQKTVSVEEIKIRIHPDGKGGIIGAVGLEASDHNIQAEALIMPIAGERGEP